MDGSKRYFNLGDASCKAALIAWFSLALHQNRCAVVAKDLFERALKFIKRVRSVPERYPVKLQVVEHGVCAALPSTKVASVSDSPSLLPDIGFS
jgi:hypothetical protein